jgi:protein-S-isoprenylcysteine O-methyltransferase Ste14
MDPSVTLFGPVDTYLAPYIAYVMLALIVLNIFGRILEYNRIVEQAKDGADAVGRHPLALATNFLLVVGAFYYLTVHRHAGMITTLLVVGLFLTDFFEFEARKVEARQGWDIERPKGAIGASLVALAYIAYQALFFLIEPYWSAVV